MMQTALEFQVFPRLLMLLENWCFHLHYSIIDIRHHFLAFYLDSFWGLQTHSKLFLIFWLLNSPLKQQSNLPSGLWEFTGTLVYLAHVFLFLLLHLVCVLLEHHPNEVEVFLKEEYARNLCEQLTHQIYQQPPLWLKSFDCQLDT